MKRKQFIISCGVLAAIILLYVGAIYLKKTEEEISEETYPILSMDMNTLTGVTYTCQGETIDLIYQEGQWSINAEEKVALSQENVKDMVGSAMKLNGKVRINEVTDFSQYGFDNPQKVITLHQEDGEITVTFGDVNAITGDYYLRLNEENVVYTIGSSVFYTFEQTVEDLSETVSENAEE